MASRAFIGIDNLLKAGSMASGAAATGMPATNITAYDQGSADAAWQTPAGVLTAAGGATLGCTFAAAATVRGLGLFRTNLTPSAQVTVTVSLGVSVVWTSKVSGPAKRFGQVPVVLPSDMTADYVQWDIDDALNTDGFINVPLAFAGPLFNLGIGFSWNSKFDRDSLTQDRTSLGGQEYPVQRYVRRVFRAGFQGITEAEHWANVDYLDYACRAGGNVLVIPNADSAYLYREALFGIMKPTAPIDFPEASPDARAWAADVTERV